jgi:hypothetical protein
MDTKPDDRAHAPKINTLGDQMNYASGLTKREYFAACALQGMLARTTSSPVWVINGENVHTDVAAVMLADALIEELNRK